MASSGQNYFSICLSHRNGFLLAVAVIPLSLPVFLSGEGGHVLAKIDATSQACLTLNPEPGTAAIQRWLYGTKHRSGQL
jgi:hypothetical protein